MVYLVFQIYVCIHYACCKTTILLTSWVCPLLYNSDVCKALCLFFFFIYQWSLVSCYEKRKNGKGKGLLSTPLKHYIFALCEAVETHINWQNNLLWAFSSTLLCSLILSVSFAILFLFSNTLSLLVCHYGLGPLIQLCSYIKEEYFWFYWVFHYYTVHP